MTRRRALAALRDLDRVLAVAAGRRGPAIAGGRGAARRTSGRPHRPRVGRLRSTPRRTVDARHRGRGFTRWPAMAPHSRGRPWLTVPPRSGSRPFQEPRPGLRSTWPTCGRSSPGWSTPRSPARWSPPRSPARRPVAWLRCPAPEQRIRSGSRAGDRPSYRRAGPWGPPQGRPDRPPERPWRERRVQPDRWGPAR